MRIVLRTIASVAGCLLLSIMTSCNDAGTSSTGGPLLAYTYTAFDTLGNTLVRGTLWLNVDGSHVAGKWRFNDSRSGELEGTLNKDTLVLNLNPGFVDNNLFLLGVFTVETYTGKWEQVGFPGVMAQGTFSATRQ